MMEEETRLTEMIGWLVENPTHQQRICSDGYEVNVPDFLETMGALEKEKYYELLVVLVIKNWMNPAVEQALTKLSVKKISESWKREGTEALCEEFKSFFMETLEDFKG